MPSTPPDFRRIALSLPRTEERKHMNHPDFRVAGKIFATLAYPNKQFAMVKLTPIKGCTSIILAKTTKRALKEAILAAWRNHAPSDLALGSLPQRNSKRSLPSRR
jgi:hypothetical protein